MAKVKGQEKEKDQKEKHEINRVLKNEGKQKST